MEGIEEILSIEENSEIKVRTKGKKMRKVNTKKI